MHSGGNWGSYHTGFDIGKLRRGRPGNRLAANLQRWCQPVAIRLRRADLGKPAVQDLLRATFEILDQGGIPWSERQMAPLADTVSATTPAENWQAKAS